MKFERVDPKEVDDLLDYLNKETPEDPLFSAKAFARLQWNASSFLASYHNNFFSLWFHIGEVQYMVMVAYTEKLPSIFRKKGLLFQEHP